MTTERTAERRALLAYAASKSLSNTAAADKFSVLVPIFRALGHECRGEVFELESVCQKLSDQFGLDVPQELVNHWLSALQKNGVVTRSQDLDSGDAIYVWGQWETDHHPSSESLLEDISGSFDVFRDQTPDLLLQDSTIDIIEIIHDELIIELTDSLENQSPKKSESAYIFGRFAEWLSINRPEQFAYLSEIRNQAIIAELILNLFDPSQSKPNLGLLNVYLDSPIVMDLVGLSGPDRKRHSEFLVQSIKDSGAILLIAAPHLDEIYSNIDGVMKNLPFNRFGPTADALRRGQVSEDAIAIIRSSLPRRIEDAGVKIDESIENHLKRSPLDESFSQLFYSRIQATYRNLTACDRDIDVVRGVMGRRGTAHPLRLQNAKAIFVTQNAVLANQANILIREEMGYKIGVVPLVIPRSRFTAMVASLFGIQKSRDISKLDLLIAARSAISYNPKVFDEVAKTIQSMSLSNREEITTLLKSDDFASILMDTTKGVPANATAKITEEVIARARLKIENDVRGEVEARFKSAHSRMKKQAEITEAEKASANAQLAKLTEAQRLAFEAQLKERRTAQTTKHKKLIPHLRKLRTVEQRGRIEYILLAVIIAGLMSALTLALQYSLLPSSALTISLNVIIVITLTYATVFRNPMQTVYLAWRTAGARRELAAASNLLDIQTEIFDASSLINAHRLALSQISASKESSSAP